MTAGTTAASPNRRHRPRLVGVVASDKRDKTITVVFEYSARHRKYGKYIRRRTKIQAHDERNEAGQGDRVEVALCRRFSKTKSYRLVRVLEKAPAQVASVSRRPDGEG